MDTTQEMTGINTYESSFASVDFPDASEESMLGYSLENNYSIAINNALLKHVNEIKDKHQDITMSLEVIWKKRFREFLKVKNAKLIEFLSCKLKTHPLLNHSENFFQKFGQLNVNFNQQSMRDIVLDTIDASDISDNYDLNAVSMSYGYNSIPKYIEQTKFLMDRYKLVGEKILDKQSLLKVKLDSLDSIHKRLLGILGLTTNEHSNALMENIEKYVGKAYEDNTIDNDYNDIIECYREFMYLRDILRVIRPIDIIEKEPLCSICFEETITTAFVPCGHTFCGTCIKKQTLNCSICRGQIRDRVKLFFA